MPGEQRNQIERRDYRGGIGRRPDSVRRGMNAANYARGLTTKPEPEREVAVTTLGYSFEFLRKWGTRGTGDGHCSHSAGLVIDGDGNVYVADRPTTGYRYSNGSYRAAKYPCQKSKRTEPDRG